MGRQPEGLAGAELWVVPNPSGLNAHETVASLATAYGDVARAAGIDASPVDELSDPLPRSPAACAGWPP